MSIVTYYTHLHVGEPNLLEAIRFIYETPYREMLKRTETETN